MSNNDLIELVPGKIYVFQAPTNTGILIDESKGTAAMIDSGIDDSQARKVYRRVTEELGVQVTEIFTTHAHADHCGGHFWLKKKDVRI